MRTIVVALLITLIWLASACSENEFEGYQIVVPGKHHGDDVSHLDGGGWYGLFKTDGGYTLDAVDVKFAPCRDLIIDGPNDTTGISVTVDDSRSLMFLVRSPRPLETGLCSTLFVGDKLIYPGEFTILDEYTVTALGQLTDEEGRSPREPLIKGYQLMLFKKPDHYGPRQVLVEHDRTCAEDTPSLIWAGDLDHDGKLDLYMDIANHYAPRHYALYLSSEAEGTDLVRLVADLFLMGC